MAQNRITVNGKTFKKYIAHTQIEREVKRISCEIERDIAGRKPLFVSILNGSFIFTADLLRHISGTCEVCFVRLSSYAGTTSTGSVKSVLGLDNDIAGRDIIVVEDIVETGRTMQALRQMLADKNAGTVSIATLVCKPSKLESDVKIKYCGFEMKATDFIVGYGLDYNGEGRNLPDIYIADNE